MHKRYKVVMLPTNEKAYHKLWYSEDTNKLWYDNHGKVSYRFKPQHLYILSDEEVRARNWYYCKGDISQLDDDCFIPEDDPCLKVIASTNPSLNLPSPSQSFIEEYVSEYNKGNIITDVLVEYKEGEDYLAGSVNDNECWDRYPDILKVSRDNTVTIKKVKDSWTRDEVIKLCKQAIIAGSFSSTFEFDEWIETNL